MDLYTTDEVVRLFEEGNDALDNICMDGSEDELGLEDIVQHKKSWSCACAQLFNYGP